MPLELSADERRIWSLTLRYAHQGSVIGWTGERWASDADAIAATARALPDHTDWTVLRPLASGGEACKQWRRAGDEWVLDRDFSLGKWFEVESVRADPGARGLAKLFAELLPDRRACLVRGIPARESVPTPSTRGARAANGVRRSRTAHAGAFLAPHPTGRLGFIIDIDHAPPPPWMPTSPNVDELHAVVRWVADRYLPHSWAGCDLAYLLSQSAGTQPWASGLSLHLGVWLDRPIYDAALYQWIATWGLPCDPRICLPEQAIYSAAPRFLGGPDPLQVPRVGFLAGTLESVPIPNSFERGDGVLVPLVAGEAWQQHLQIERDDHEVRRLIHETHGAVAMLFDGNDRWDRRIRSYVESVLVHACVRVADAGMGGRHPALIREALGAVGGYVRGGLLDERVATECLLRVFVAVAGVKRTSEGRRTIRDGFRRARVVTRDELIGRLEQRR